MNYAAGDVVEQLQDLQVSADTFKAFGIPILRGRSFTDTEDSPGGPRGLPTARVMRCEDPVK